MIEATSQGANHDDGQAWAEAWFELHAILSAHTTAGVVAAACELGVFSSISSGCDTPDELASRSGVRPLLMRLMLNVLAGMAILERTGVRYRIGSTYTALLRPGPQSMLDAIARLGDDRDAWRRLGAMQPGRAVPSIATSIATSIASAATPIATPNVPAPDAVIAAVSDLVGDARTIVELGDGSISRALGARTRTPEVVQLGAHELEALAAISGRDLVILNELAELPRTRLTDAIAGAFAVLAPHGRLLYVKLRLDACGTEPPVAAVRSLDYFVRYGSHVETDREAEALVRAGGGTNLVVRSAGTRTAIVAEKRTGPGPSGEETGPRPGEKTGPGRSGE